MLLYNFIHVFILVLCMLWWTHESQLLTTALILALLFYLALYSLQREGFALYKEYGECNEQAQKLLYELYEKPVFKGFFVVSEKEIYTHRVCR